MKDKFTATWVSYSSMSDYLKCPRAYFIRNVYRDPKSNRKVTLMEPPKALGQVVHDTIDTLSLLRTEDRFSESLLDVYLKKWQSVHGEMGGFRDNHEEEKYKNRGEMMIRRIITQPGPLREKTVKLRQELPHFWLSEDDSIILCGKIDWIRYYEKDDSIGILDFKTGKFDEDPDSLQLPIYLLLAKNCQKREVKGIQYWYLERDAEPVDLAIPDLEQAKTRVLEIAKRIALARKLERFVCSKKEGCFACKPLEQILSGKAKRIGTNDFGQDVYVLQHEQVEEMPF